MPDDMAMESIAATIAATRRAKRVYPNNYGKVHNIIFTALRQCTALQVGMYELHDESIGDNLALKAIELTYKELGNTIKDLKKEID